VVDRIGKDFACSSKLLVDVKLFGSERRHASDNLWALKVFIRVEIAGRQGEVKANKNQKQIDSSPHRA
jgi:hypothetical protein